MKMQVDTATKVDTKRVGQNGRPTNRKTLGGRVTIPILANSMRTMTNTESTGMKNKPRNKCRVYFSA